MKNNKLLSVLVIFLALLMIDTSVMAANKKASSATEKEANSILRISCDGDDVGAEVQIDGKFKGECPLDISVGSGSLRIKVTKKSDSEHEPQIFEQEIRLGEGVVKKLEVSFAPAKLNAQGLSKEDDKFWAKTSTKNDLQDYLKNFPNGKYVNKANEKLETIASFPNPSDLPFKLDEKSWKLLYESEAFRNMPASKAYRKSESFQISSQDSILSTSSSAKSEKITGGWSKVLVEENQKNVFRSTNHTSTNSTKKSIYVLGGLLELGYLYNSTSLNWSEPLKISHSISIDEVRGTMFPMRAGNVFYIKYKSGTMVIEQEYETLNSLSASTVDKSLNGNAWEVKCVTKIDGEEFPRSNRTDYFLEEYGLFLGLVGRVDMRFKAYLPTSNTSYDLTGFDGTSLKLKYLEYNLVFDK